MAENDRNPLISVAELESRLEERNLRIVDCRFELTQPNAGREAYLAGHVPGAVYADLDADLAGPIGPATGRHPLPDADTLAQTFGRLGIGNRTHVVVYDDWSGALAARAWWLLRWLGHEQVQLLEGGIAKWSLARELETGAVTVAPEIFRASPDKRRVLAIEEIIALSGDSGSLRLVDARDAARYRGENEPIDKVAGHIPGAISLPYSELQHDDGTWLQRDELRQRLAESLGDDLEAPWCVMCGSGVTACHLAISGSLAGVREPRLYVGSWSEWITDPARPVVTGPG